MQNHGSPPPPAHMPNHGSPPRPAHTTGAMNESAPARQRFRRPSPAQQLGEYIEFETTGWHLRLNQGIFAAMWLIAIIKLLVTEMSNRGFSISEELILWLDVSWLGATSGLFLANVFRGPNYWARYFWSLLTVGSAYFMGASTQSWTGWQVVIGLGILVGMLRLPVRPLLPAPVQVPGPNLPAHYTPQPQPHANPGNFELQHVAPHRRH